MPDRAGDELAHAQEVLLAAVAQRRIRCAVIGQGFIGSTWMDALIDTGIEAHGYDRSDSVAAAYRDRRATQGTTAAGWSTGCDASVLRDAQVVVVAVRLPLRDGVADLEPLRGVLDVLVAHRVPERLVLLTSTLPPGTTRRFAAELRAAVGRDAVLVAHAPERLAVGHGASELRAIPHLVGGVDAASSRVAEALLGAVCQTVVPVSSPEVSELAKLLENGFRSVGIALVGEIARLAHAVGITATEVCDAAATKPFGYFAFQPGAGLGGHCLPNDLQILIDATRAAGLDAPLLAGAATAAERQPATVVDRLESLVGRKLDGAAVLIVGVGFKVGSADTSATPARDVVRILRQRGARVSFLDASVAEFAVDGEAVERVARDALERRRWDACLLLAGDPSVDGAALQKAAPALLDVGGGGALAGMPIAVARL